MSISGKKIAILGGGLGGLVCAISIHQLCAKRGVSPAPIITVYERDVSSTSRAGQGYAINIRDCGYSVMSSLGLWNQMLSLRAPGHRMLICDSSFNEWIKIDQGESKLRTTCRIQRSLLRQLLIDQLPANTIIWNKVAIDVRQSVTANTSHAANGQTRSQASIHFSDGSIVEGVDLVIAADGARSKIRGAVTPEEKLNYMGVEMLTGEARWPIPPTQLQQDSITSNSSNGSSEPNSNTNNLFTLPADIATGSFMSMGSNGTSLFMAPMTPQSAVWMLGYHSDIAHDEVRTGSLLAAASTDCEQMQSILRQEVDAKTRDEYTGAQWKSLINATPTIGRLPCYDKLPHAHRGIVTFIGDSCHAFTPYSGNGANMAMMDGWQLADELTSDRHVTIESSLVAFESVMFPRVTSCIKSTRRRVHYFYHTRTWYGRILRTMFAKSLGMVVTAVLRPRRSLTILAIVVLIIAVFYRLFSF